MLKNWASHSEQQDRPSNAEKTLGRLRSIIPTWSCWLLVTTSPTNHRPTNFWNFENHFFTLKSNCEKGCNLLLNWYRKSISTIERVIYIYIYVCVCVEFLASHFNDLSCCISKFTAWAMIEELSIHRRLHTFLISREKKTRVKHGYADLSSWFEF